MIKLDDITLSEFSDYKNWRSVLRLIFLGALVHFVLLFVIEFIYGAYFSYSMRTAVQRQAISQLHVPTNPGSVTSLISDINTSRSSFTCNSLVVIQKILKFPFGGYYQVPNSSVYVAPMPIGIRCLGSLFWGVVFLVIYRFLVVSKMVVLRPAKSVPMSRIDNCLNIFCINFLGLGVCHFLLTCVASYFVIGVSFSDGGKQGVIQVIADVFVSAMHLPLSPLMVPSEFWINRSPMDPDVLLKIAQNSACFAFSVTFLGVLAIWLISVRNKEH